MESGESAARVVLALADEVAGAEIERLVESCGGLTLVASSRSAHETLAILRRQKVDLLICSARLPDQDGFDMLDAAGANVRPGSVIILSCAEGDAVRAFEAGAVDFVRLPASEQRLALALRRARRAAVGSDGHPAPLLTEPARETRLTEPTGFLRRLVARSGQRWVVVPTESIRWIEARGKYLRLHCDEESYHLRSTVQELFAQLDPARFFRIHRSTVVRLDEVREFASTRQGDCRVRLRDGAEVLLTRDRRRSFVAALAGGAGELSAS